MAKILVVDDQKTILIMVESILKAAHYDVVTATCSYDALQALALDSFDLIVTDAVMPGGVSGFELVRKVRISAQHAAIPIIMLTGKREAADVQRGIEAGANDYIVKPVDPMILVAKIGSLLGSRASKGVDLHPCSIHVTATLETEMTITSISELGLTLNSPYEIASGTALKLNSSLFDEIGISTPVLRTFGCELSNAADKSYLVSISFVGLSEKEMQPIRLFVTSKRRAAFA